MLRLKNYLKADFYKLYHGKIIKLHVIISIITAIVFLAYCLISPWSDSEKLMAYFQIISMAFPLVIAIVVNMVYEQEQQADFQYFLSIADNRYKPHISKLISIFILGLMSTLIAILGFGSIFNLIGNTLVDIKFYIKQSFVIFGSNMIIYMIQYLIVFFLGKGASISIGIVGSLISALMVTSIGEGIWPLVPWAYSIRLSSYFTLNSLNILFERQPIFQAIIIMAIYGVIFLVLQLIFSSYWEGKKEN